MMTRLVLLTLSSSLCLSLGCDADGDTESSTVTTDDSKGDPGDPRDPKDTTDGESSSSASPTSDSHTTEPLTDGESQTSYGGSTVTTSPPASGTDGEASEGYGSTSATALTTSPADTEGGGGEATSSPTDGAGSQSGTVTTDAPDTDGGDTDGGGGATTSGPGPEALCEMTGGIWDIASCGHYLCGNFPACDAIEPGCDCGSDANFVENKGCLQDDGCWNPFEHRSNRVNGA